MWVGFRGWDLESGFVSDAAEFALDGTNIDL